MPRNIKFSQLPFSVKLFISLLVLAIVLFTILFILIIPRMEKEQYDYKIKQIEQTISLNTQQLKLAVDFIITDGKTASKFIKNDFEFKLHKIKEELSSLSNEEKKAYLEKKEEELSCTLNLLNSNNSFLFKPKNDLTNGQKGFIKENKKLESWHVFRKKEEENFCPSMTRHIVTARAFDDKKLLLSCNTKIFYNYENSVEKRIKNYVQKSFSYTDDIHRGNTFLMWLNVEESKNNRALYDKEDKKKNKKYCISNLSNVESINTGSLSAKQILNASNKKYIRHKLNNKEALTWVRAINDDKKRRLIFITTIYEEDLYNKIDSVFKKILPASLLALFFSVFIGYLLFRKFSKSLDILVSTSKKVRAGNLRIRSRIKGKDHIGVLGHTFDLMLDSMEDNIKTLDLKVEERTKELKESLDEKNTLLKEIHHRVKNNLSFTINILKLQKRKVSDEKTKELLSDVQERIYTMELLHRKLYESKDLSSIPFKKYIYELVDDITYAYNITDLKVDLDIDEVNMDIEHAMPCGLIINECITNSFKYAFKEKDNKLSIKFKKKDSKCHLEIWDNGKGLPKDLDINKTKSLGLRLITSISKAQLQGNIEYKYEKGTKFIIDFDIGS